MKTYYFVRHGASTADTGEMDLHGMNAPATVEDIPLSDRGREEAERCAEFFARIGGIQAVYSSPLERTLDTGKIIANRIGAEISLMPEVREVDLTGVMEFFKKGASKNKIKVNPKDLPYDVYRSVMMMSSNFLFFMWLFGNLPGNEPSDEARARLEYAFSILDESPYDRIVVASHGFFITFLASHLIKNDPGEFFKLGGKMWVPNCSVTKITSSRGKITMKYFARDDYDKIS